MDDNNALLEMLGAVAAAAGVVAVVTPWQAMSRRRNEKELDRCGFDQCCNVGNRWLPTGYNIPKAGFVVPQQYYCFQPRNQTDYIHNSYV